MAYIRELPSGKWQATVRLPGGGRRSFTHPTRPGVERWAAAREDAIADAALRAELRSPNHDGIDPRGCYVYLLWRAEGDDIPLYVGSTTNLLSRIGKHLDDHSKRPEVGWVTFIWCASPEVMIVHEGRLIRKYRPPWNKHIPEGPLFSEDPDVQARGVAKFAAVGGTP
jgi:hypothetical protein